jgi:hypothetical protein
VLADVARTASSRKQEVLGMERRLACHGLPQSRFMLNASHQPSFHIASLPPTTYLPETSTSRFARRGREEPEERGGGRTPV